MKMSKIEYSATAIPTRNGLGTPFCEQLSLKIASVLKLTGFKPAFYLIQYLEQHLLSKRLHSSEKRRQYPVV
jgi:hypothetical protein